MEERINKMKWLKKKTTVEDLKKEGKVMEFEQKDSSQTAVQEEKLPKFENKEKEPQPITLDETYTLIYSAYKDLIIRIEQLEVKMENHRQLINDVWKLTSDMKNMIKDELEGERA